jgi:hypothetical protein
MLIFNIRKVYKMKYFQKISLSLLAIVVMTLGNKVAATAHTFDPDTTDLTDNTAYVTGGDSIVVDDNASANGTGNAVILTGASSVPLDVLHGILKVGNSAATGSVAAIASTGANTVENGAILEITAATTGCIPGALEVKSGGILQVDANIPSGSDVFGSTLQIDSGAVLKLGSGVTWGKDINVHA